MLSHIHLANLCFVKCFLFCFILYFVLFVCLFVFLILFCFVGFSFSFFFFVCLFVFLLNVFFFATFWGVYFMDIFFLSSIFWQMKNRGGEWKSVILLFQYPINACGTEIVMCLFLENHVSSINCIQSIFVIIIWMTAHCLPRDNYSEANINN